MELLASKGAKVFRHTNNIRIPCYVLDNTDEGAHEFNTYYHQVLKKKWNSITRTSSGGVSIAKNNFKPPMWDVKVTNSLIELTIVANYSLRIQFRQFTSVSGETQKIYGRQGFETFKNACAYKGIDLNRYKVSKEEGWAAKQQIPKYLIKTGNRLILNKIFDTAHHIDFHNSFPAGLCNTHEEFRPIVEKFYRERKIKPINKAVLNYTIGFFQSEAVHYAWAHLSRDAIVDNNRRVEELAERLRKEGYLILLYNTDGIWYYGNEPYHGEGEGPNLGEWENDHTYCKFRAKSEGAYEFIEDGKYNPVIRGRTNLDKIKPRSEWEWGDIYKKESVPLLYYWIDGEGIVNANDELL